MSRHGPCPSRKAAWERIKAGEGFIYLAKVGHYLKIGFALDPEKRMPFVGHFGRRARLLATTPGTLKQEQALHRVLYETPHALRHPGEYYRRAVLGHPACRAIFGTTRTSPSA